MTTPNNPGELGGMKCENCGKESVELVSEKGLHTTETGLELEYLKTFSRCSNCGDEFFTVAQSMAHSRAIVAAVRDALGLISPNRIVAARRRLGLTQSEFEHALGVGKKTVVRWERGTVAPSSAANGLLWVAERHPEVFLEYARERAAFDPILAGSNALFRASVLQGASVIRKAPAPSFFDTTTRYWAQTQDSGSENPEMAGLAA